MNPGTLHQASCRALLSPMFPPARLFVALLALCAWAQAMPHGSAPPDLRAFDVAAASDGIAPGSFTPDFRLTDHRGVTHELYYESTAKAIVLVYPRTDSARSLQTATALRALRARFSAADVVIWQIDSSAGASRAKI